MSVGARWHIGFLDGIRGLAALYVLLHHVALMAFPSSTPECPICLDAPAWATWLRFGQLAVVVFIVVSGFSLSLSPFSKGQARLQNFRTYITRRAFRIVPPYWVALALSCLIVIGITGQYTGNVVNAKAIIVHGLLINNVIDSPKPNGTFWSIAVEWQIYFIFPLLLLFCRRKGVVVMTGVITGAVVCAYLLGKYHSGLAVMLGRPPDLLYVLRKILYLRPQFLALFTFGVAAAYVTVNREPLSRTPWTSIGAGLSSIAFVLLVLLPTQTVQDTYFWIDLLVGAATATTFVGLIQRPGNLVARFLGSAGPRWLGQSSYSLYLVHDPILQIVGLTMIPAGGDPVTRFILLLCVAVPASVGASRIFWRLFEAPFMTEQSKVPAQRTVRSFP